MTLRCGPLGDGAFLEVEDDGPGIPRRSGRGSWSASTARRRARRRLRARARDRQRHRRAARRAVRARQRPRRPRHARPGRVRRTRRPRDSGPPGRGAALARRKTAVGRAHAARRERRDGPAGGRSSDATGASVDGPRRAGRVARHRCVRGHARAALGGARRLHRGRAAAPPARIPEPFHLNPYEQTFGYSQASSRSHRLYLRHPRGRRRGQADRPGRHGAQLDAVYANLEATLKAEGGSFAQVVMERIYTTDMDALLKVADPACLLPRAAAPGDDLGRGPKAGGPGLPGRRRGGRRAPLSAGRRLPLQWPPFASERRVPAPRIDRRTSAASPG